jgi:murein DD-endopeptidase MepM/ murein hydrolase activator NlpD
MLARAGVDRSRVQKSHADELAMMRKSFALLAVVVIVWSGNEATQQATTAPIAYQAVNDREQRALDLLVAVGNDKPTSDIVSWVVEWSLFEDRSNGAIDRNNPWNTTQPGFNDTGCNMADCVREYPTWQDGLAATVHTLTNGSYNELVAGMQTNDPQRALQGLVNSPWAASHYNYGVDWPQYQFAERSNMVKCPYTATMQIGDNSSFYSTGASAWSGQYGGMHLGDDFVGNRGDPVYAPFAMSIEGVGEYTDPGRFGRNVQARFTDGTLYYAGHLVDVYVSAGQQVPACTIIGTLGATDQPHVHIKLGSPSAPVPCEGSAPGDNGCIDPMAYWESH